MKLLYQAWTANDAYDWLFAASLFVLVLLALALARSILRRVLAAFATRAGAGLDNVVVHVIDGTKLWLLLPAALYAGMSVLNVPRKLASVIALTIVIALIAQAAVWLNRFIVAWIRRQMGRRTADGETITALSMISFAAQILVWVLAAMLILDQLAFDITALVAGLGIGGIAVALAVQNILGDLLASLSIVLDKPFVVGDSIMVGEDKGVVEHIGIKTTRVRAPNGQVIVFSNNDLLKSRIHNYKRMQERRVPFTLEVVYQTSPEMLQRIPDMIRRAVELQEKTRFDRAHLKECGAHGYVFEALYTVLDGDIKLYMDIHQQVNLHIIRTFERENIEFAYPTQTLFIQAHKLDDTRRDPSAQPVRRLSAG
ncbi:MAG: Mechanosensitive ion channel protein MscS [Betaproteobacteria bacterium]|jgi:small-conductance mechanosensitive channel|nr:Mechanosensitive ion channel protein MscS [Betaproteobacteria bacterium]